MTFQQFVEDLEQSGHPSPLLKALQDLRTCDLDELRDSKEFPGLYFCGWPEWPAPCATTPEPSVQRVQA